MTTATRTTTNLKLEIAKALGGAGYRDCPKHWLSKADAVLAANPTDAQGVQDATVNADWMRGARVSRFDLPRYEKVLALLNAA